MLKEIAAGGVVLREGKLLLVRVENLAGEKVWTFPKGHLEKGETPAAAALREVEEETGWSCRIAGPLMTARYRFTRSRGRVSKTVKWYRMEPTAKVGKPDAKEILATRWVGPRAAAKLLSYPSDAKLLETVAAGKGA